jgi:hypothetical protein
MSSPESESEGIRAEAQRRLQVRQMTKSPTTNTISDIRDRLLPCPFCGGGSFDVKLNGQVWTGMRYGDPVSVSIFHWCDKIEGQPSRPIERIGKDVDSAIEMWNTRKGN